MSDEYDYLFKSIVVGDGGVGKTALTLRFSKGFFTEDYKMTIGVDFHVKTISIDSPEGTLRCKLQIWDTGGQERFSSIRPMYYRGSLGGLLIFDLTNYESFEHLPQWLDEVRANIKTEIPLLLVGNKSDLIEERKVSIEEINEFTRDFNLYYMETSAKTGEGVGDCFHILACLMVGVGVPEEFVTQGIAFNPGEINLEVGVPTTSSESATLTDPVLEFEAPPVPEPNLKVESEPEPELEFEAPPVPEPEIEFEAPPIPEPEIEFEAPPVPEPEIEFETPPIPEPEPTISFEPEPELEFEAPPVPEPEIDLKTLGPEIPTSQPSSDLGFKMPDEILSALPEEKEEEPPSFTPLPSSPVASDDISYKPKAVPFTSNIPVPVPAPSEFTKAPEVAASETESKPIAPFILNKRPETPKPQPASLTFEAPPVKEAEPVSTSSPIFTVGPSTSESSESLVDYMPETILSKKERKKLEKKKKKEAKLKAKAEKEKKIQEAKEKYQKELEEKKKAKKSKKKKEDKEKKEEKIKIPEPTTPTPTPAAAPSSLFQTLSTKTEDSPLSAGASFIPFSSKEKSTSGTSKLRIIPNVDDLPSTEQKQIASAPSFSEIPESTDKKKEIIICKQCGAILSNDYAFCNKCGAKL
ncbi:MAG: GTP-binding protein [Promethearchaeota archaeon]